MSGDILGVVLAGGLSRRMGGGDKALLKLRGQPLITHVLERIKPQVDDLILNANGDPARFDPLGLPVVADDVADFSGPLAGVLAAMAWARRERPMMKFLASVSADAPFVPLDLVSRLSDALSLNPDAQVAVAASRGRRHHVIGLWRLSAEEMISGALARGERRAETMVDRLGAVAVEFSDADFGGEAVDPFFNINTPDDLAVAERFAEQSAGFFSTEARGNGPFVVGVAGWKNSGKTTLVEKLVAELVHRGVVVSTVKRSHHDISFEADGTDSARHRKAGSREVAIVSPSRWAVVDIAGNIRWKEETDAALDHVVGGLAPADIVIVEGCKRAPIAKVEVRRIGQSDGARLSDDDPDVVAIAADHDVSDARVPTFRLDDIQGITDFVLGLADLHSLKKTGDA